MTDSIVIKGIKQGVLVQLSDDPDWPTLLADLASQIDQRGSFFRGAQWVVDINERSIGQSAIRELQEILATREVEMLALLTRSEETLNAARRLNLVTDLNEIPTSNHHKQVPVEVEEEGYVLPPMDSEEYGTGGVLIKRTLRSGRTVRSGGHVVVIGDVNSGAEIIAVGDIVVWGKVRGVVHAGADGDENAVVCALDLAPTQLRIASLITVPPQDKRRKPSPEMARINNGQIEAIPWN